MAPSRETQPKKLTTTKKTPSLELDPTQTKTLLFLRAFAPSREIQTEKTHPTKKHALHHLSPLKPAR
jgi:hypothetical protein